MSLLVASVFPPTLGCDWSLLPKSPVSNLFPVWFPHPFPEHLMSTQFIPPMEQHPSLIMGHQLCNITATHTWSCVANVKCLYNLCLPPPGITISRHIIVYTKKTWYKYSLWVWCSLPPMRFGEIEEIHNQIDIVRLSLGVIGRIFSGNRSTLVVMWHET